MRPKYLKECLFFENYIFHNIMAHTVHWIQSLLARIACFSRENVSKIQVSQNIIQIFILIGIVFCVGLFVLIRDLARSANRSSSPWKWYKVGLFHWGSACPSTALAKWRRIMTNISCLRGKHYEDHSVYRYYSAAIYSRGG